MSFSGISMENTYARHQSSPHGSFGGTSGVSYVDFDRSNDDNGSVGSFSVSAPADESESAQKSQCCCSSSAEATMVSVAANAILAIVLVFLMLDDGGFGRVNANDYTNAACNNLCRPVCTTKVHGGKCFHNCYAACDGTAEFARPAILGKWLKLDAIQHVGLTTSNLSRSVDFYTRVMGGVEVVGAGGDNWQSDEVYQLLMQAAVLRGGGSLRWTANISAHGPDSMDARYISFGSMILELLDYHSNEAVLQRSLLAGGSSDDGNDEKFPKFSDSTVPPSVAGNMHISFNVREDRILNDFVSTLERESHAAGFPNVVCNRLVPVKMGIDGRPDVRGVPVADNSFHVDTGSFQGWNLAYCKGPDDEQLEFNQVKGKAKATFEAALETYFEGKVNPKW